MVLVFTSLTLLVAIYGAAYFWFDIIGTFKSSSMLSIRECSRLKQLFLGLKTQAAHVNAVHLKAVSIIIAMEKTIQREYTSLFECEFFVALTYSQCIRSSYLLHMYWSLLAITFPES